MKKLNVLALPFLPALILVLTTGCKSVESIQSTNCISKITEGCEAGYAKVNDIVMYYEVHGEGEPLLLLHGGTGRIESFDHQIPVLAEHYRVIAPDSRAHGRTTDSDKPLSYALMADDMLELLDLLEVNKVHVVGWSDGGNIGLDLAINHPERVGKLVVIGANFSPDGLNDELVDWVEKATAETWSAGSHELYKKHAPDPSHWPVFIDKIKAMWLTQPNYTREELARVQAPTLVMVGENEEVVRQEHTEEMHQILPNADLKIIPNTGHLAPIEKPEEVNEAILEFLKDE